MVYEKVQKDNSSWNPAFQHQKSESLFRSRPFSIPAEADTDSAQEQEIPAYSRADRDAISAKLLKSMEGNVQSQAETQSQKPKSEESPAFDHHKSESFFRSHPFSIQPQADTEASEEQEIPTYTRFDRDAISANLLKTMRANVQTQAETEVQKSSSESEELDSEEMSNETETLQRTSESPEAGDDDDNSANGGAIQRHGDNSESERHSQGMETEESDEEMSLEAGAIQRQEELEDPEDDVKSVQTNLTVGAPGDKYEQEADSVAAQVMSISVQPAPSMPIQRQGEEEDQEPSVQRSSLADSITPLVQRLPEEQEEPLQAKSLLQRAANGNAVAGSNVESQLNSSKGGGSPLPDEVRSFMEPRFGVDFSSVRVHTDSSAVQMNKELGARAFAHGSDIYYGSGKSPAQDDLTAHELTHVVQQTGAKKLQPKSIASLQSNEETLQAKINPAFSRISIPEPKIHPKENPQQLSNKEVLVQKDELPKADAQTPNIQPKCAVCGEEEQVQTLQLKENPQQQKLSNKEELPKADTQTPNIQPKCAACGEEEQVQRQPIVKNKNITPIGKGDPTIQAFGWEDVKNTASAGANWVGDKASAGANWVGDKASAGANWVGDKASQAASLGKDAFASIVARVAPGLADLIRSGPVGLLTEKIKEGVKGWLSGVMANVDIGSVITGLKSSFAGIFATIQGLGKGDAASCGAFAQSIKSLQELGQAFMDNPVIKQIQAAFSTVSGIFKKVSNLVIAPAFDALTSVAGGVFNAVKGLATTIWGWGAPVRNTLGAAWDWVKEQLGIGGDGEGGILNWLKTKALDAWTQIKEPLAPVIGPLKTVGSVLLAFSPVGPVALIIKFVPQLVQSVQWLWAHKDDKNIVKSAHEQMGKTILPGLLSAVQGFSNAVQSTVTGLVSQAVQLSEAVLGLLGAITGVPLLSVAQSLVESVSNGAKELVAWGQEAFQSASQSVQELFATIKAKIEPYAGVLSSLALAIANPAMIPVILAGSAWRMLDDCYKAPIINFLLDTVIGLLKAAPSLPMFGLLWPMIKAGVIGFLEGVKGKPDNEKVAITNKLAKIISGGSPAFILGFVKGLLKGIWEGLTDPFVLIYEAIKGLGNLVTWLNDVANQALSPTPTEEKPASAPAGAASPATAANKNVEMGQRMQQMAGELQPPVQQVSQGFMPAVQEVFSGGGGMSFEQLMQKLGDAWAGVETAIRNAGGTLADKVCQFMLQDSAEGEMGETVGWLAGTIAFEVVLGILTAGSWTAAKGAMKGLKLFAKILDWTGEAMGLAFKGLAKVGGFILDGIKGLGKLLDKAGGAAKAILDALGEIGQKLISFADELLGRAAKGAAGEVVEEGAEKATNQAIKQGAGEVAEKFGEKGTEFLAKHGDEGAEFLAHYGDDALNLPANQIDDFLGWKKKLTPETQQFFKDNPELWRVYANMDPDVRKVLTLCNSPCIPSGATAEQANRIKGFLSKSGLSGDNPGLKKYLHDAADLDAAINKIDDLAGKLDKNVLDSLLNNSNLLDLVLRNPDASKILTKFGNDGLTILTKLGSEAEFTKLLSKLGSGDEFVRLLNELGSTDKFLKLLDDLGGVNDLVKLLDDVGGVDDLVLLLDSVTDVAQLKRLLTAVGSNVKQLDSLLSLTEDAAQLERLLGLVSNNATDLLDYLRKAGGKAQAVRLESLINRAVAATGDPTRVKALLDLVNGNTELFKRLTDALPNFRHPPLTSIPAPPANALTPPYNGANMQHFMEEHTYDYLDFSKVGQTQGMWPPGTTGAEVAQYLEEALKAVKKPLLPYHAQTVTVRGMTVKVGVKWIGTPGLYEIGQFYPMAGKGFNIFTREELLAIEQIIKP